MATKKYDLAVKVGEANGKGIWKNVGALMESEKGPFILLDKWFNPAGLATPDRTSIMVSLFEPKPRDNEPMPPF